MPYLSIRTNAAVAQDDRPSLLAEASSTLAAVLGKPERYVMVDLDIGVPMQFAGSDAAAAALIVDSIGLAPSDAPRISAALCAFVEAHLAVPADRVYIRFSSTPREMWGWNGGTF